MDWKTSVFRPETAIQMRGSGKLIYLRSFTATAMVVLDDGWGVGLAHYSFLPDTFAGGGDMAPLTDGQVVTIVGLGRTSAERLVVLSDSQGGLSYAPLMRSGRIVFEVAGEPVMTMEEFDARLPGQ